MEQPILGEDYYRGAKVSFVSNHNGTTALEVMSISLAPELGVLISALFTVLVGAVSAAAAASTNKRSASITQAIVAALPAASSEGGGQHNSGTTEFLMLGLPVLLCLTCASEHSHLVLAATAGVALSLGLAARRFCTVGSRGRSSRELQAKMSSFLHSPPDEGGGSGGRLPHVVNYRASMLYVTSLCILGVDFPVFPRRFAKAETFGFGLMDIGVGSFVFAAGLVALEARKGQEFVAKNRVAYLLNSVRGSVPMLMLGFLRYFSLKGSGYHTHESEYGLHWNFFFTMAVTKILSSFVYAVGFRIGWSWVISFVVIVCHEMALGLGLGKWIVDEGPRTDLISANREGLVSCVGYTAIYFAGVSWGEVVFAPKSARKESLAELKSIGMWSLVMWSTLFYSSEGLSMSPSRRLVNWPYFVWMVGYNLTLLCLYQCTDLAVNYARLQIQSRQKLSGSTAKASKGNQSKQRKEVISNAVSEDSAGLNIRVPQMYQAIDYNSLGFFLLANVLTGLVNLSMETVNSKGSSSMFILIAYLLVLQIVSIAFYRRRWRVKLS